MNRDIAHCDVCGKETEIYEVTLPERPGDTFIRYGKFCGRCFPAGTIITGFDIGKQIVEALGFGSMKVRCIDLHIHVDEIVTATATVEKLTESGEIERFLQVFELLKPAGEPQRIGVDD